MIKIAALILFSAGVILLNKRWVLGILVVSMVLHTRVGPVDISTALTLLVCVRYSRGILKTVRSDPYMRGLMVFVGWSVITLLWAEALPAGMAAGRAYVRVVLASAIAIALIRKESDLEGVMWGGIVSLGILLVRMRLLSQGVGVDIDTINYIERSGRLVAHNFDPTFLGLAIAWCFVITGYMLYQKYKLLRRTRFLIMYWTIFVLSVYVAIRLGTRAALICLFLPPLFMFTKLKLSQTVMTLTVIGIGLFWVIPRLNLTVVLPFATEVTNQRITNALNGVDDTNRFNMWQVGMVMAFDHPFGGVALGNSPHFYRYYVNQIWRDHQGNLNRALHNSFITIFAETGLIGFFLFVMTAIGFFKGSRVSRLKPRQRVLFNSLIFTVLVTALFHSFEQASVYMFLIAAVYSVCRYETNLNMADRKVVVVRRTKRNQSPFVGTPYPRPNFQPVSVKA